VGEASEHEAQVTYLPTVSIGSVPAKCCPLHLCNGTEYSNIGHRGLLSTAAENDVSILGCTAGNWGLHIASDRQTT
jgi:hypothetical protein